MDVRQLVRPGAGISQRRRLFFSLVLVSVVGCAAERPFVWVQDTPLPAEVSEPVIHTRDTLVVAVRDQPSLSGEFVVRDDGAYLHPTLGTVQAAGMTVTQLRTRLRDALRPMIVNPDVSVSLAREAPIRVNVVGEVRTPGIYELTRDRSVAAALAAAGWLTDFAAKDRIFVVRSRGPSTRIRFRAAEITTPEVHAARFRLQDEDVVVVE